MFSLLRRLSGLLHRPSSAAPADDDTPGGSRKGVTGDSESVYSEEKIPMHCVQTLRKRTLPSATELVTPGYSRWSLKGDGDPTSSRSSWPSITIKDTSLADLSTPIGRMQVDAVETKCRSFSRHPQILSTLSIIRKSIVPTLNELLVESNDNARNVRNDVLQESMRKKLLFVNDVACKEQVRLDCIELDELKSEYGSRGEVRAARKLLIDWLAEVIFARIDACQSRRRATETKAAAAGPLLVPPPPPPPTSSSSSPSPVDNVKRIRVPLDPTVTPTTRVISRDRTSSATTMVSKADLLSRPSYPTRVITTTASRKRARGSSRGGGSDIRSTPVVSRRLSDGGVVPMSMSPKATGDRRPRRARNSIGGHEAPEDFTVEWTVPVDKKRRRVTVDDVAARIRRQIAELDTQGEAFWHLSCLKESSTLQTLHDCKIALEKDGLDMSVNRRALGAILVAVQHLLSRPQSEADIERLSAFIDAVHNTQTRDELIEHVQSAINLLSPAVTPNVLL